MSNVIIMAIASVSGLGLICSIMLAIASKVMAVEVDERVSQVGEIMPGANCGACGYAGCDGYANAIVNEDAETNLCTPGGAEVSKAISSIMGVEAAATVQTYALVCCRGDSAAQHNKMEYSGIESCKAAKQFYGGQNACVFGCLGFGDCAAVCPNNAICVDGGLARVLSADCIGCKLCVKACPNDIIVMEQNAGFAAVMCMNTEKGAVVRKKCSAGCIACTKCVRECPVQAIEMRDNLAVIDYSKCTNCGKCAESCITKCIRASVPMQTTQN